MRHAPVIALLLCSALLAGAQQPTVVEKQPITLDVALKRGAALRPKDLSGLAWLPDGQHYAWFRTTDGRLEWVGASIESGDTTVLVDDEAFAKTAKDAGFDLGLADLRGATWRDDGKTVRVEKAGALWDVRFDPLTIRRHHEIPPDAAASARDPEDRHVAYVVDHDIHVLKPDGTTFAVTHGGFDDLTHGVAVSRVEFGITDGLWWSPDGRYLAFYREDLRPIEPYPYVDFTTRPARRTVGRYPMAGRNGSVVSIGVYDTRDDSVRWLATDPARDEYLTNVTWGPRSDRLYVAHVNRDQNHMDLRTWNAADGQPIALLFTETDEQWVEPEHGPIFLPDGSGDFLWFSPRDGFNHLYLYEAGGHLMQQLTRGAHDVAAFRGFAVEGRGFFFETTGPNPLEMHLYRGEIGEPVVKIEFAGPKTIAVKRTDDPARPVTTGRGQHATLISPDGRHVLDTHSDLALPLAIDLLTSDGAVVRRIHEAPNPLADYVVGEDRLFKVEANDGQDLHGHLFLPPNLDTTKKYPVLLYVYGGPHSQLVTDSWEGGAGGRGLWFRHMASLGFIVVRLDGHGTLNRGIEWVQTVHRRLGTIEIEDQLAALDHVRGLGFADMDRVGVHGWSYGGFMTLCLMTRAGDHFRAGLSGAPVTDWRFYETGYGERYMDRPAENEKGYDEADPGNHVKGLQGRLLVVHGSGDLTVVWQNTIDFVQDCIDASVDVDYMVYPGELHGLRGKARDHLYTKMTKFFVRELGGPR